MRNIVLLFIILSFIACKKEPFFSNFDTVEYYRQKSDSFLKAFPNDSLRKKTPLNQNKSTLREDGSFYLEQNFERINFSSEDVVSFKSLINENVFSKNKLNKCFPIYRDVLILKNSKKVIGIVNICFDCDMYHIKYQNENKIIQRVGNIEGNQLKTLLENLIK